MSRARNPVIPESLGQALLLVCMVCQKPVEGFYARFGDKGTCSGACMRTQNSKPRYPGYSEEEFFQRQGERDAALSDADDDKIAA